MKYSIKDNNLTLCICSSSLISYCFILFIDATMFNVTLNTKHVEVLVFRHLSGAPLLWLEVFRHLHRVYFLFLHFNLLKFFQK